MLWGYFLYQGVIDPFGGIWTLWPLFGTANQMLAAIALTFCTVVLFKMKRERYAWVTVVPATWLVVCTVTAGLEKVFSPDPAVGFVSHARQFSDALAAGKVLAPAKITGDDEPGDLQRLCRRDPRRVCSFVVVLATVISGYINVRKALGSPNSTTAEVDIGGAAVGSGHA